MSYSEKTASSKNQVFWLCAPRFFTKPAPVPKSTRIPLKKTRILNSDTIPPWGPRLVDSSRCRPQQENFAHVAMSAMQRAHTNGSRREPRLHP
ncbi:uncharacterized protein CLUP02_04265 [Colletotrichum lupini]|uniref:Uncharacterized protein n=1 Tax=Colletotrichum lupini TaxID=145971 RepID=A0A9Q8WCK9_9PEZI|nr:uncharacterized protein CLUP02_04265 [Colletotrichum lupini]UQC78788.1 hypothetical protein CLUP02_04265 [Colletotrichum lupini]